MNAKHRLSHSLDIKQVQQHGKSYAGTCVVILVNDNQLEYSRFGVIASTAIGHAVQRNRARRRIKECFNKLHAECVPRKDILVIARRSINNVKFAELCSEMTRLLHKAGIMVKE